MSSNPLMMDYEGGDLLAGSDVRIFEISNRIE